MGGQGIKVDNEAWSITLDPEYVATKADLDNYLLKSEITYPVTDIILNGRSVVEDDGIAVIDIDFEDFKLKPESEIIVDGVKRTLQGFIDSRIEASVATDEQINEIITELSYENTDL
jgi:hypothetical protein